MTRPDLQHAIHHDDGLREPPVAIQRLDAGARERLLAHFIALPTDDRRLRFGSFMGPEIIAEYVDRIDFERDALFGVFDNDLELVGVAHVGFVDDGAELGVSVLPACRDRGIGGALLARAAEHARNRGVVNLYVHCLAENAAMMHVARKAGMRIAVEAGDAGAHLTLPPPSPLSITGEIWSDQIALLDYALKAQAAAWRSVAQIIGDAEAETEGSTDIKPAPADVAP